jgi:hypothetical protein
MQVSDRYVDGDAHVDSGFLEFFNFQDCFLAPIQ